MRSMTTIVITVSLVFLSRSGFLSAQQRLKLGTGHKALEVFYLPIMAAEERGIWSRNGVEVEWVPFGATGPLMKAMAASHIKVGLSTAMGIVPAIARGLPAIMVAEYQKGLPFAFHVSMKSPIKEIKDFKGLRVAVSSRGGSTEMIARIMGRATGVERDMKFVAVGGTAQEVAALRVGIVDTVMTSGGVFASLVVEGQVRTVGQFFGDTAEGTMIGTAAFARKDFTGEGLATLSKLIKALAQASDFVANNPGWGVEKIKSERGQPQKTAEYAYKVYKFTGNVAIVPERVESLRTALIEFGLLQEREVPRTADLFTNRFIP